MLAEPVTARDARQPARLPLWLVSAVLWACLLLVVLAHGAGLGETTAFSALGVIFTSIVVEALPFILIGAVVSGAIAAFVPDRAFTRIGRLPRALQVPGAAVAGFGFPVCECGSVPVARRLMSRGIDPAAGLAFMLAAPVLNPIVLGSTFAAYQATGRGFEMTAARAGLGLLVAIGVALALGHKGESLLRPGAESASGHSHSHDHPPGRLSAFVDHVTSDFFFMGRFLVLGAAVSAVIQTLIPQELVSSVGGTPVLSALTMMLLAFVLSLCSEADAFVAVSFTAFPLGSQLAFLVIGPLIDAKLAVLYGATFRRGFVPRLILAAVPMVLIGSLLFVAVVL